MIEAKPTTVFFDLDGTLVFGEPDNLEIIAAFCAEIGQPLGAEDCRRGRRVRYGYFADPVIREQLTGVSREEFWRRFNRHMLETMGIKGDLDLLAEELSRRHATLKMTFSCPDTTLGTLAELRARGYQLGLITNRENLERFQAQIDELGLRPYLDLLVAAGEVGASKPSPAIFHWALQRAGVTAEQALHVGDNYWADAEGARGAGLHAALIDPYHLFPEAECLILDRVEDLLDALP
jgi:HAD superfamily hydrolase (TIGR01549 family)